MLEKSCVQHHIHNICGAHAQAYRHKKKIHLNYSHLTCAIVFLDDHNHWHMTFVRY